MTAILVQIKNRNDSRDVVIDQAKLNDRRGFFPPNDADVRPYITLLMNLRVQTAKSKQQYRDSARPAANDARSTPAEFNMRIHPPRETRNTTSASGHPRYAISVEGCSRSVYAVIKNRDAYVYLLGGRDIYEEHPRQDGANLRQVRRLKPGWTRSKDCYDWANDRYLQNLVNSRNQSIEIMDLPEDDSGSFVVGSDAVESDYDERDEVENTARALDDLSLENEDVDKNALARI
ncbi:uncharacterized protein FIBRA_03094 [Fibroporia radiculosa]|uniref:Uncharacterized protein n=1 Tax=Fibroporia radiculosa TaxID=599839 RepID=J4I9F0_9APHY|nr:uncharacterized protein FIBRA_03094 [Fibroporia radiculosa]CCM01046.1 predicted protein [Fibroporia radiculosa]